MAKPTNLRAGSGNKRCGNCTHFAAGHCNLYDYDVTADQLSDGFKARSSGPKPVGGVSFSQTEYELQLAGARERLNLAFDESLHPRGPGGNWIKKGAWARVKNTGSIVQITDPTPGKSGEVASHHVGRIAAKGSLGAVRVDPAQLEPFGDVKLKKATVADHALEGKRVEVHVDGKHIGDLVHTEGRSPVMARSGGYSVGSTRHRFWNHVPPGGRVRSTGSGHSARGGALDSLLREHQKS